MTKLSSALKREFAIGKAPYVPTIDPSGFKLVVKGMRRGIEIARRHLVSGEAAMVVALKASLSLPGRLAAKPHAKAVRSRQKQVRGIGSY